MTKSKTTKRALLSSCIALMLCFSMLLGTTYAWFTDEVTSSNNIIKSGTLDATLEWAEAYEGDSTDWTDAASGAIFNYDLWEPGYTDVKYVKVANVGTLAFQYRLNIIPEVLPVKGEVNLADVIDVYCVPAAALADRDAAKTVMVEANRMGTLAELMAAPEGADTGVLLPANWDNRDDVWEQIRDNYEVYNESAEVCLILHMQESAGNDYQNLSVGDGFSVQLLAQQMIWEEDSFDHMYDQAAKAPDAEVTKLPGETVNTTIGMGGAVTSMDLVTRFLFKTTETTAEGAESPYAKWHADFVVTADKTIPANAIALAGYYAAYCDDYNNGNWVALQSDVEIEANTNIRLLELMLNGGSMNYKELCEYVPEFECGVAVLKPDAVAGTTINVELRLYEIDETSSSQSSTDCETGEYVTIGTYTYTIPSYEVRTAEELAAVLTSDNKSIDVTLANDIDLPITSLGSITGGSGEYKLGGADTKDITIDLNGNTLNITTTYWSAIGAKNDDAKFTIKNGSMTSSQPSGTWNSYDLTFANCNYVIEDVTFDKAVALCNEGKTVELKNVTISETHDYYALWITAEGQTVEIEGLTIESAGRGIKIDEQYVATPAKVTLKVSDAEFNTAKKAAIMVKSAAGADIEVKNIDISGVAADTVNAVWVDADADAYADKVAVTGATVINEP